MRGPGQGMHGQNIAQPHRAASESGPTLTCSSMARVTCSVGAVAAAGPMGGSIGGGAAGCPSSISSLNIGQPCGNMPPGNGCGKAPKLPVNPPRSPGWCSSSSSSSSWLLLSGYCCECLAFSW